MTVNLSRDSSNISTFISVKSFKRNKYIYIFFFFASIGNHLGRMIIAFDKSYHSNQTTKRRTESMGEGGRGEEERKKKRKKRKIKDMITVLMIKLLKNSLLSRRKYTRREPAHSLLLRKKRKGTRKAPTRKPTRLNSQTTGKRR